MRTPKLCVAALASAIAAGAAAPAGAGESVETKVTLRIGDTIERPPLYGRVISDAKECVEGRRVAIVVPGEGVLDYADNRTNAKGKWSFGSQLQGASRFRARVKETRADGITCAGAASPVKSFAAG
jgi:hypothetical protein